MYIVRIAIYLGICIKLIQKINSWNWTPEQKNLLIADIPRMIMRSHWSTGKTIILFKKAKVLARKGEPVLFVLCYSKVSITGDGDYLSDQAPILLYCSLWIQMAFQNIKQFQEGQENVPNLILDQHWQGSYSLSVTFL